MASANNHKYHYQNHASARESLLCSSRTRTYSASALLCIYKRELMIVPRCCFVYIANIKIKHYKHFAIMPFRVPGVPLRFPSRSLFLARVARFIHHHFFIRLLARLPCKYVTLHHMISLKEYIKIIVIYALQIQFYSLPHAIKNDMKTKTIRYSSPLALTSLTQHCILCSIYIQVHIHTGTQNEPKEMETQREEPSTENNKCKHFILSLKI